MEMFGILYKINTLLLSFYLTHTKWGSDLTLYELNRFLAYILKFFNSFEFFSYLCKLKNFLLKYNKGKIYNFKIF